VITIRSTISEHCKEKYDLKHRNAALLHREFTARVPILRVCAILCFLHENGLRRSVGDDKAGGLGTAQADQCCIDHPWASFFSAKEGDLRVPRSTVGFITKSACL
jgi:hypothetical protein